MYFYIFIFKMDIWKFPALQKDIGKSVTIQVYMYAYKHTGQKPKM